MEVTIPYLSLTSLMTFNDYIVKSYDYIRAHKKNLYSFSTPSQIIVEANSPFEICPPNLTHTGALFIHGLLDCPFALREVAMHLANANILTRGILLPGHGTNPEDLRQVRYEDWIAATAYGVETLKKEVKRVFLIGFSTGGALAIHRALNDPDIAGVIIISPAIRIKAPIAFVASWNRLISRLFKSKTDWVYWEEETDYAKYHSIPYNAVKQVSRLTNEISRAAKDHPLNFPLYIIVSLEDETISSRSALSFFSICKHEASRLLLYTPSKKQYTDARITVRSSVYPDYGIKHFSHISLPFSPRNSHYGKEGDYIYASHHKGTVYGAYNKLESSLHNNLYRLGLVSNLRRELTFNPDFDFMTQSIATFINHC